MGGNGFLIAPTHLGRVIDPTKRTEIYPGRRNTLAVQQSILEGRPFHGVRLRGREAPRKVCALSEANKRLLEAFQTALFAKGTKPYRVAKLTACLRLTAEIVGKDFDGLTKADAETFLARVNRREDWSPHTRRDYVRNFKQFFLWFEEEDPRLSNGEAEAARKFYQAVRKIKTGHPQKKVDPGSVITEEDKRAMIRTGCENSMERAAVAFLHESGCRVGEFLGIRIRDLQRKGQYAIVTVDGKTGERSVPILQSLPYVEEWLRDHPARENPDALLWVSLHNGHRGEPLRYIGVRKMLRRIAANAGLKKRVNPHWFRHSHATDAAAKYPEQILCRMMGWELGSKQVRTYCHVSPQQVEDKFLDAEGVKIEERKAAPKIQVCVCEATNEPEARYCRVCGRALSVGVMLEDEDKKSAAIEEAMQEFARIMADPDLRARFATFKTRGGDSL